MLPYAYYLLLGVTQDALLPDIRKSYREKVYLFHPDRLDSDLSKTNSLFSKTKQASFELATHAWKVLSHPIYRYQYNSICKKQLDYQKRFLQITTNNSPKNIYLTCRYNLIDIFQSKTIILRYNSLELCPVCAELADKNFRDCELCLGSRVFTYTAHNSDYQTPCPGCQSREVRVWQFFPDLVQSCTTCYGSGTVVEPKKINFLTHSEYNYGDQIILREQGHFNPVLFQKTDIIVCIQIENINGFYKDNLNILGKYRVSPDSFGKKIYLLHLNGRYISIDIPVRITHSINLHLPGQGFRAFDTQKVGDLLINLVT